MSDDDSIEYSYKRSQIVWLAIDLSNRRIFPAVFSKKFELISRREK
jgi:hypothetical protein